MPVSVLEDPANLLSAEQREVLDVLVGIYRHFQLGQPEKIRAVQATDTTVWDAYTPYLITHKERLAFHQQDKDRMLERGEQFLEFIPLQIEVTPEMAFVVCMLKFEFKPPRPISGELRISTVFMRRNGEWKQVHHHEAVPAVGWPDELP